MIISLFFSYFLTRNLNNIIIKYILYFLIIIIILGKIPFLFFDLNVKYPDQFGHINA